MFAFPATVKARITEAAVLNDLFLGTIYIYSYIYLHIYLRTCLLKWNWNVVRFSVGTAYGFAVFDYAQRKAVLSRCTVMTAGLFV